VNSRLEGSRIPDYRKNSLFGQKDFDHSKFAGFGNYRNDLTCPRFGPRRRALQRLSLFGATYKL